MQIAYIPFGVTCPLQALSRGFALLGGGRFSRLSGGRSATKYASERVYTIGVNAGY